MAFKAKTKNRNPINTVKTLDAIHSDIINNFEKDKKYVHIYEKKLAIINESIENLSSKDLNKMKYSESINIQREIWDLKDVKEELENKIADIKNNSSETSYLLETGQLLEKYYKTDNESNNNLEKHKDSVNKSSSISKRKNKKKSILDWMEYDKSKQIQYDLKTGKPKLINDNISKNKTNIDDNKEDIVDCIIKKTEQPMSKNKIYKTYMKIIDKDYIKNSSSDEDEEIDVCDVCNKEMLLEQNTGILLCPECGMQEQVIVDSDKPSYKDPPKEITSFCYRRINHLNEFLAQFQAKETTEIPEELYNEILMEIKKERIKNMADITPEKMRQILKKIRRNDYYEHIPYIINQLNGLPPPIIRPEVEEIIRSMFKEIQIPFEKYCPKDRTNFLSYNYVMYKFFELLELDEYLPCFQLLKSRNKLYQQDQIWKNICKDLGWEYIASL